MKQWLWLGIVGLVVGVAFAYLQTGESNLSQESPSASTTILTVQGPVPRLCLPEVLQSPAPIRTTSPEQVTLAPLLVTPNPPPKIFIASPIPAARVGLFSTLPTDNPVGIKSSLPDDGSFWSTTFDVKPIKANGSGGVLNLVDKKAAGDTLQTMDVSNMSDIGVGYRLIKNRDTTFLGRLDGGFSRDYACLADGQKIPELLFGAQLEHQLSQRNKIFGAIEYAHDITDSSRFRLRSQAAWEVLLDPNKNLSLRTGVLESSNKAPNGERAQNLDCRLDLIWKF